MKPTTARLAGFSAYANASLSLAIMLTLALLFVAGDPWGQINDAISIFWALTFLPILLGFYELNRARTPFPTLVSAVIGLLSALTFATLQILLVLGRVAFEQTFLAVTSTGGVLGFSILLLALLTRRVGSLPARVTALMIIYGLGFVVSAVGFGMGGWQNPLAAAGYIIALIAGLGWTIALGRILLAKYPLTPVS